MTKTNEQLTKTMDANQKITDLKITVQENRFEAEEDKGGILE